MSWTVVQGAISECFVLTSTRCVTAISASDPWCSSGTCFASRCTRYSLNYVVNKVLCSNRLGSYCSSHVTVRSCICFAGHGAQSLACIFLPALHVKFRHAQAKYQPLSLIVWVALDFWQRCAFIILFLDIHRTSCSHCNVSLIGPSGFPCCLTCWCEIVNSHIANSSSHLTVCP